MLDVTEPGVEIFFSLVIPMFNESARLTNGTVPILEFLHTHYPSSQVILVDDGSTDDTADQARIILDHFPRLRSEVIRLPMNRGKGAAVREGMKKALGKIHGYADADNATPIEQLKNLLPMVETSRTIVIGSRGLNRALLERRQPRWRETMGRAFNVLLRRLIALPYRDTQCGFKLFGSEAARICFSKQTLDGFSFDVELLWIARQENLPILEVPVRWRHVPESRVKALLDSLRMARDVIRIWASRARK